jgi:hypothetical protein
MFAEKLASVAMTRIVSFSVLSDRSVVSMSWGRCICYRPDASFSIALHKIVHFFEKSGVSGLENRAVSHAAVEVEARFGCRPPSAQRQLDRQFIVIRLSVASVHLFRLFNIWLAAVVKEAT